MSAVEASSAAARQNRWRRRYCNAGSSDAKRPGLTFDGSGVHGTRVSLEPSGKHQLSSTVPHGLRQGSGFSGKTHRRKNADAMQHRGNRTIPPCPSILLFASTSTSTAAAAAAAVYCGAVASVDCYLTQAVEAVSDVAKRCLPNRSQLAESLILSERV